MGRPSSPRLASASRWSLWKNFLTSASEVTSLASLWHCGSVRLMVEADAGEGARRSARRVQSPKKRWAIVNHPSGMMSRNPLDAGVCILKGRSPLHDQVEALGLSVRNDIGD